MKLQHLKTSTEHLKQRNEIKTTHLLNILHETTLQDDVSESGSDFQFEKDEFFTLQTRSSMPMKKQAMQKT